MMPILVKGDDPRSGTKANARHGPLQAARVFRGHVNSNSPNKTLLYYLQFVIWTSDNLFKIKRGGVHNYTITLYKPCIHVCIYM